MRFSWPVLFLALVGVLAVGCSATVPELPACPDSFYDSEKFRINYVHDDGDGEYYYIEYYVDVENITPLLAKIAADAINPFAEVEIGEIIALLSRVELDANLDITPCDGGES